MKWGPEIEHDGGDKPAWVGDDDVVLLLDSYRRGSEYSDIAFSFNWHAITSFQLPADHWAYPVIADAFTPWAGSDDDSPEGRFIPPVDWDGGEVMLRSGRIISGWGEWRWTHLGGMDDIIGYHRKEMEAWQPDERTVRACIDALPLIVTNVCLESSRTRNRAIEECLRALELLLPKPVDPDLNEARRIEADICIEDGCIEDAEMALAGSLDHKPGMKGVLRAIKRGRELERGE